MNRARDNKLVRGQIVPRLGRLVRDKQWAFVLPTAAAFYGLSLTHHAAKLAVKDVAVAEIALSSLSFGACITGLVLTLNLNNERASVWARTGQANSLFSHLSDLIFVFVWSALSQLAVIFSAFLSLTVGAGTTVYVHGESWTHRTLLGGAVLIVVYAFFQLLSVVRTLTQIGVVTINALSASRSESGPLAEPHEEQDSGRTFPWRRRPDR